MDILVIGCGSFGSNIAAELERVGHQVSVMDKNYESFAKLPADFTGKRISGDALVKDVLTRARVEQVNAVVLTLNDDILNLTLARLLQDKFKILNLIAVNTNPALRALYDETGVLTISMLSWGVLKTEAILANLTSGRATNLGTTEVGVYNVVVPKTDRTYCAEELVKINFCLFFAITRNGITKQFNLESIVESGDVLHISANAEGLRDLFNYLGINAKEGKIS